MVLTNLNRRSMIRKLTIGVMTVGLSISSTAWAGPPRHHPGPDYPELGKIFRDISPDRHTVNVGRKKYVYHDGIFYHHGPNGFIVTRPPRGAIIAHLPVGFETLVLAGVTYFLFAGVYYQKSPSGYVVVDEPVAQEVVRPAPVVTPAADGQILTVDVELLNVRSGPGKGHGVISQVRLGDRLVIQGSSPGWYYVQLPDGTLGWVMGRFTHLLAPKAKG